jgi:YCII-related domain
MSKFLILYRSHRTAGEQMAAGSPEEMQASLDAWMAWGGSAGAHLVDFGSPTMPTTDADPGPDGWIGGYSIMEAADLDELTALLEAHPHRRDGAIEVLQMLDMPGA